MLFYIQSLEKGINDSYNFLDLYYEKDEGNEVQMLFVSEEVIVFVHEHCVMWTIFTKSITSVDFKDNTIIFTCTNKSVVKEYEATMGANSTEIYDKLLQLLP